MIRSGNLLVSGKLAGTLLVACLFSMLCGCYSSGGLDTFPVSGYVTVDGEPFANADVVFSSPDGGRSASGRTDADGWYSLRTTPTVRGALAGNYQVRIFENVINNATGADGGPGSVTTKEVWTEDDVAVTEGDNSIDIIVRKTRS